MVKIIGFEGCVGSGKTSLTNYFSYELNYGRILEKYDMNPFLRKFYEGSYVNLETEITFLLLHYWQLKNAIKNSKSDLILADFSIEKDLVYAKLNLNKEEFKLFGRIYDYVVGKVGVPYAVIYIDLSLNTLKRRISQRGRRYEIKADPTYFKQYNDKVKEYFTNYAHSKIYFFNVDHLKLESDNKKLKQIREKILETIEDDDLPPINCTTC